MCTWTVCVSQCTIVATLYLHIYIHTLISILLAYTYMCMCICKCICICIRSCVHSVGMGYSVLSPCLYTRTHTACCACVEERKCLQHNGMAGSLMVWTAPTLLALPVFAEAVSRAMVIITFYTNLCVCLESCTAYSIMVLTPLSSIFIPSSSSSCDHFVHIIRAYVSKMVSHTSPSSH